MGENRIKRMAYSGLATLSIALSFSMGSTIKAASNDEFVPEVVTIEITYDLEGNQIDEAIHYNATTPEELLQQAEAYERKDSFSRKEDKWKEGTVVWDGKVGNDVTTYFWKSGKNIRTGLDIVAKAQKKAVEKVYTKVEDKYEYKMTTTQKIQETPFQTGGQITVSATAVCHSRRLK